MEDKGPWEVEVGAEWKELLCCFAGVFLAMHDRLWQILSPFSPSVRPLHSVLVLSGGR